MYVRIKKIILFFLLPITLLQGCASSDLSREAAGTVNNTYSTVNSSIHDLGKSSITDTYQNSSQSSKGVLIGGVTGGVVGGFANGVGAVAGVVTGAILGGALGAYIDAHSSVVDQLQNRGAKVFVLGDQVLIVIPSSRLFYSMTPTIDYSDYTTLDLVAQLIGNYANMSVKVAAYTDTSGNVQIDRGLSQQQADSVEKYLWKRGVDTRLIYAVGYGGTHLVTKTTCDWNSDNYRIEITWEKLPV